MKIADLLRDCRQKKNLTVRQMAQLIGVNYTQWSRWETGAKCPRLQTLLPLAMKLNLPTQTIIAAWLETQNTTEKAAQ